MDLCAGRGGCARHRKFYQELTDELCQIVRSAVLAPSYEPVLPWGREYLWHWFVELSQGRQEGFSGPQALSWRDMSEWASLTNSVPRNSEWRTLRAMDAAFLSACRDKPPAPTTESTMSGRELTPELFDALFQ